MTDSPADDGLLRSVELDRAGAYAASTARLTSTVRRPGLWVGAAVVVVLALVAARALDAGVAGMFLAAVAAVFAVTWVVNRASMKAVRAVYPDRKRVSIESTPEGFTLRSPDGAWSTAWTEFGSAEVVRRHLLLRRRGAGPLVLVPALWGPDTLALLEGARVPVTSDEA